MPSIFDFFDYRDYLKAYFKALPKRGHGEAKKIAEYLGISPTFVSQVLSGTRGLSSEQAHTLSKYFGLSTSESDFFFYQVQLERAGTEDLKKYLREKLEELKKQSLQLVNRVEPKRLLSDEEKSIFYSSALYSAVHLFTSTSEAGKSLEEIMARFELSRSRVTEIVRFLVQAGFVQERAGKYHLGLQNTHLEQTSPHLLKHHANWRIKAIQTAETLQDQELMYTSQVSLSQADFATLREEMVRFIKDFLARVHASPADEVACFNLDWFWIRK